MRSSVRLILSALIAVTAAAAAPARAQVLTPQDCREGSDFIRNAALSRDNGVDPQDFAQRLEGEINLVMAMPIEVRWFVYTDNEAGFLRQQVQRVFQEPQPPETHHQVFLRSCQQMLAQAASVTASAARH